jgi:hypothetical protein
MALAVPAEASPAAPLVSPPAVPPELGLLELCPPPEQAAQHAAHAAVTINTEECEARMTIASRIG